jgi:putative transposase
LAGVINPRRPDRRSRDGQREHPEQAGVEPELVTKVAVELMASSDACDAQLLGEDGLLTQVTKAVLERALSVEMTEHLGYQKGDRAGRPG